VGFNSLLVEPLAKPWFTSAPSTSQSASGVAGRALSASLLHFSIHEFQRRGLLRSGRSLPTPLELQNCVLQLAQSCLNLILEITP
jgi:hypothetical protein